MKECLNCKTMLEDDELFCHECGTKQEIEEIVTQNEETTTPLEKECIHCGEKIDEDSAFCPYCGKSQTVEKLKGTASESEKSYSSIGSPKPQEAPDKEETTSEWEEEESSSKKWIWTLLILLLVAGGAWLMYNDISSNSVASVEAVDNDSIDIRDAMEDVEEDIPTSELDFLEQFYKGNVNDAEYIKQHVTANVLNKLKQDYDYDCPSNDCIAVWLFDCYHRLDGIDNPQVEGPIISKTDNEGKYKVVYQYAYDENGQKRNGTYTIIFTVTKVDGKFKISDYKVQSNEVYSDGKVQFIHDMYKDFYDNKDFSTNNVRNLKKYLSDKIIGNILMECPYEDGEGEKRYVVECFADGSLTYERPDLGDRVVMREIRQVDDDWYEVINYWDTSDTKVRVILKVTDLGGNNYKVTDYKMPAQ